MDDISRPRLLCVDDDGDLLQSIAPHLEPHYCVDFATTAIAGLQILERHPETAVIVSDMVMPGMDGVKFLAATRAIAPDARRILMTGCGDLGSAMAAVNEGQICRFVTKPCDVAALRDAIEFAMNEYRTEMAGRSAIRRFAVRDALRQDRTTGFAGRERLLEALASLTTSLPRARMQAQVQVQAPVTALYLLRVHFIPAFAEDGESADAELMIAEIAARLSTCAEGARCLARWDASSLAVIEDAESYCPDALKRRGLELCDALSTAWDAAACITVQVQAGIVAVLTNDVEPQILMAHAEIAAQRARTAGPIAAFLYTAEAGAQAEYHRELVRSLRRAIADGGMELHYQPIVDIESGEIHAIEALARWRHPQHGPISPGVFVPLAESAGLIVPFGGWVLREACRTARALRGDGFSRVAVNVSVIQLLDDGFLYSLFSALEGSGLPPTALEVEVTESVFAHDVDRVRSILSDLRKMGVEVAIDDFGTGYSSLAYLNGLPASIVKTDASFLRDFERGGEAIIGGTIEMARKLGLQTIVEGVETAQMLAQAQSVGARLAQGYYFARPMPAAELGAWRDRWHRGQSGTGTPGVAARATRAAGIGGGI